MHLLEDLPIRRKLTVIILFTTGITLALASVGFVLYGRLTFRRDMVQELAAASQMLAFNSASALSFDDARSAAQTLQSLSRHPTVVAACLYDQQGKLFATYPAGQPATAFPPPQTQASEAFGDEHLEVFRPVQLEGEFVGTIYLRATLDALHAWMWRYALIVGGLMVVALLIASAIAAALQRLISAPVVELAEIAGQVAVKRDYSVRAARRGRDEVGRLIDGFNEMLDEIQTRDTALRKANDTLEQRVEERTAELQRENVERRRAEEALQASEEVLKSLVENLPVHIFRKDREGRFTFANQRFCERQQIDYEKLIGRTAFDLLQPDEAERQTRIDRQIIETGQSYETVEPADKRVNRNGFIHLIKVPIFDRNGECVGVQGMFLDVTERVQAEARLAEASGLLEAMLENSPDYIYFKDRESRFVRFSHAIVRWLMLRGPEELRGRTDKDFFEGEHSTEAFNDEQEILRTGIPIVGKLEREVFPDGRVTWGLTTKMPWRDGTGAIVGTFGITKDVTALKEAEAQLAYERDQLRALLASSPDTIYFKDLESRFVRVSRSKALKTLERVPDLSARRAARGLPPEVPETEMLTGLSDFDTYLEEDARRARESEQEIIRTGTPIIGIIEKQAYHDGAFRWNLTSKMPWRDNTGRIIGTFGISKDITDLKQAEEKIEAMHRQLMETSRQAGMAEVATGVLHNVGNVLNSVNVSATLVADHVRHSKAVNVAKLAALLAQNRARIGEFMTSDPRGRMIPDYVDTLAQELTEEHNAVAIELEHLRKNIEHIKDIVAMQQAYARTSGVTETISVPDMIEDALRMNAGSLARHEVQTVRDYQARPVVTTDKHKVMQILINLVRNAKYACDETGRTDKRIIVRLTADEHWVRISVVDNGVGIVAENLTRIFNHGFTTRKHGHGFGLHSGALAAKELGGELSVESEGVGRGAMFVLKLPYAREGGAT